MEYHSVAPELTQLRSDALTGQSSGLPMLLAPISPLRPGSTSKKTCLLQKGPTAPQQQGARPPLGRALPVEEGVLVVDQAVEGEAEGEGQLVTTAMLSVSR